MTLIGNLSPWPGSSAESTPYASPVQTLAIGTGAIPGLALSNIGHDYRSWWKDR
ncbi:hypothetical protein SAMD00019534_015910, partial [Acytostelium subglobosum LB1]|uniref:hypothetical protein n=1 Tax=Acytostelium subglobosum LB1 TaxID=1410327 RepID=UPI000644A36A